MEICMRGSKHCRHGAPTADELRHGGTRSRKNEMDYKQQISRSIHLPAQSNMLRLPSRRFAQPFPLRVSFSVQLRSKRRCTVPVKFRIAPTTQKFFHQCHIAQHVCISCDLTHSLSRQTHARCY